MQFDSDLSAVIYHSLEPELTRKNTQADVQIILNQTGIELIIEAEDLTGIRSALNSYLRWINCIKSINELIQPNPK